MQKLHKQLTDQTKAETGVRQDLANDGVDDWHEDAAEVRPLSRIEADALKKKLGGLSLQAFFLKVLVWQAGVGVATAAMAWWVTGSSSIAYSVLYGAACSVLPTALVVRSVLRPFSGQAPRGSGNRLTGLFVLELIKVLVTVGLLLAAPYFLREPEWVAIVVGFVVTLKIYWFVALMALKPANPAALHQ